MTSNDQNACKPDFSTTPLEDRERQPAGKGTCKECPFMERNRGRANPFGHYQDDNLTRYWRGISQDGNFFTCHMFAVDAYAHDERAKELGFKDPVNIGHARECAGTVAMIRRELEALKQYESWEAYKTDRPTGLSHKALEGITARLKGDLAPALNFSDFVKAEDVIHPEDWVDTQSYEWGFSPDSAADLAAKLEVLFPGTFDCNCPTCRNHEQIHPGKELVTANGSKVTVDAELHPLLAALAEAGITTTASCINLHEAVSALSPGEVGGLTNMPSGAISYRPVMLSKGAFIRFGNNTDAATAFIAQAHQIPGTEIATSSVVTQIVFPQSALEDLTTAAQALTLGGNDG